MFNVSAYKKLHRFTPDLNRIIDTCTIYSFFANLSVMFATEKNL